MAYYEPIETLESPRPQFYDNQISDGLNAIVRSFLTRFFRAAALRLAWLVSVAILFLSDVMSDVEDGSSN